MQTVLMVHELARIGRTEWQRRHAKTIEKSSMAPLSVEFVFSVIRSASTRRVVEVVAFTELEAGIMAGCHRGTRVKNTSKQRLPVG